MRGETTHRTLDIRDPIHGYIRLSPLETALLDTPPLRRLRSICQLGLTDLVYPGATHNRFSHSLGVMHLAGRFFDHLVKQSPRELLPAEADLGRYRQLIRVSALLHDIGHSPFSHALEELFPRDYNHEKMAEVLINDTSIGEILTAFGGDLDIRPADVINVIRGELPESSSFLYPILSGELDVDKMDYLLRDSHYCGVAYGHYDLERLLYTVTLLPGAHGPNIGVLEGGIHALEAFVLARYYMFTQVYFDPTSKILEKHLEQFLLSQNHTWPITVSEFLDTDDIGVLSLLKKSREDPHASRVLNRDHYPLVYETDEHLDDEHEQLFSEILKRVSDELPPGTLFCSNATKDPHHFSRAKVQVLRWDDSLQDVTERSSFIGELKRINQFRVYVSESLKENVQQQFIRAWRDSASTD